MYWVWMRAWICGSVKTFARRGYHVLKIEDIMFKKIVFFHSIYYHFLSYSPHFLGLYIKTKNSQTSPHFLIGLSSLICTDGGLCQEKTIHEGIRGTVSVLLFFFSFSNQPCKQTSCFFFPFLAIFHILLYSFLLLLFLGMLSLQL